ncbi:hypothetical protein ACFUYE_05330 [Micromonospora humida]|uniref:hypothetical protein n=1 Tax=Micromonospora humida TaxID=2809018 RepID=UPI00366B883B
MADMLATPEDLASLLERDDLDLAKATLLVECGTAVVQVAAGGQRIVEVVDDTAVVAAGPGQWLSLPQWPVRSVASVDYGGTPLAVGPAGYRSHGSRLWRRCGWSDCPGDLVQVTVVYSHGYAEGAQELQFARGAVLGLIRDVVDNPAGLRSEQLDDWSATYSALSAQMDGTPALRAALRRQYGRRR